MNISQHIVAQWIWWIATALCAVGALILAWYAKNRRQDLGATYLGDLLVLFLVFDIANPNRKALAFSALGAGIKAGMTLLRVRKGKL